MNLNRREQSAPPPHLWAPRGVPYLSGRRICNSPLPGMLAQ